MMSTLCHQIFTGFYRELETRIARFKATSDDSLAGKMWEMFGGWNRNLFITCQALISTGV